MATGWKNPTRTFRFNDPEWATDVDSETGKEVKSYWIFRTDVSDEDRDQIRQMVSRTVVTEIPERERKKAIRDGTIDKLIAEHMHEEMVMSTRRATLLVLGKGWEGPEFILPEDFTTLDEHGNEVPHPMAGQPAPYTAPFIGLRDPDQLDSMFAILNRIWAGRSPEEQNSFREASGSAPDPRISDGRAGEDPLPLATDEVLPAPSPSELQPA